MKKIIIITAGILSFFITVLLFRNYVYSIINFKSITYLLVNMAELIISTIVTIFLLLLIVVVQGG